MHEPVYSEPEPAPPALPLAGRDVTAGMADCGMRFSHPAICIKESEQ